MPTEYTSDAAIYDDEPFTMGQLCAALEAGRMFAAVQDGAYEISHAQVRRWQREETSVRALLDSMEDDLDANDDLHWLGASAFDLGDSFDTPLDTGGLA